MLSHRAPTFMKAQRLSSWPPNRGCFWYQRRYNDFSHDHSAVAPFCAQNVSDGGDLKAAGDCQCQRTANDKGKVKTFDGRIRSRLPNNNGHVCFAFEHTSGAILQLRIKPRNSLPLDREWVTAVGELVGPGIISAEEIRQDGDAFGP
jgi:hypothetical protein